MENNTCPNFKLISLIKYLYKNVLQIFIVVFIGGLLGFLYASLKKNIYTATVSFTVQEESKMGGGGLLSLASSFGVDVGGPSSLFSGENIEQVFKSRKILERALTNKFAEKNKTFGDYYLDVLGVSKNKNFCNIFADSVKSRHKDSLIQSIHKLLQSGYLDVSKPNKKYDIYEINFKSTDEVFAKYFVEEIVQQVSVFYTETKTKKAKQNVNILQNRVDSIHNAIGGLMTQKASLADANLNPLFQIVRVPEQKRQLDLTALTSGYGELLKNLELAKYSLLKETPLFQIIDEPKFPLHIKKYSIITYTIIGSFVFFILSIAFLIFLIFFKNIIKIFKINE
jgi:uncharacterized protein involved in exopolysaccharide biosynthesis